MNDPRPDQDSSSKRRTQARRPNAEWAEVSSFVCAQYQWVVEQVDYQGWPYIVVMAIREIQVGEEILIEYGEGFWQRKKATILSEYILGGGIR